MRKLSLIAALAMAATPATAVIQKAGDGPGIGELTRSSLPAPGQIRTVSIGNAIHEYNEYIPTDMAMPLTRIHGGVLGLVTIEAHTPMYSVPTNERFKACGAGGCAIDDDGDGTFDRVAVEQGVRAVRLHEPVRYERRVVPLDAPNNLRQMILYQGTDGTTLRLSYREFRGDFARPAFTEDLLVPITRNFPQDVVVKDIRFRIHGVDGTGLRYEVVAP